MHQNRGKHKDEASLEELIREFSEEERVRPDSAEWPEEHAWLRDVMLGKKSGRNLKTVARISGLPDCRSPGLRLVP